MRKSGTNPLLCDANCHRERKDSKNALRPRRFKECDFSPILYDIVLYAGHFLLVRFFPSITLINYVSSYRQM